ncbi:MAG: glycosyltransferase family 2 protein [Prolixibacteraceae bacterium]|jgi:glycosyltransferase involved in cell wall biosynthesis|nr:glycosyltransferase family 2 protein [Prolixibacteraceae bacterium]
MKPEVLVVIPAYNEQETIQDVIFDIKNECPDYDILVVNDASHDETSMLAKATGVAKVIDLPVNLGIGGAVQTGFKYANKHHYSCVVQFDADGQHRACDLIRLVKPVLEKECDVVIGSRFVSKKKAKETDFLRRIGIFLFEFLSLVLIGKRVRDHTSGFRAFNSESLAFIMHEYPVDYPEPEIIVLLVRNKFKIKEIFTQMYTRQGGVSSIPVLRGPYYMFKVTIAMLAARLRPLENV